jgi:hypothetical protein
MLIMLVLVALLVSALGEWRMRAEKLVHVLRPLWTTPTTP